MGMEEAFLQAIRDRPADESSWLVLADWLEERGDPRAELVRLQVALRRWSPDPGRPDREERLRALLAAGLRPLVPERTNAIGMRLALLPPGSFLMGSPESEFGRASNEGPQRLVEIGRPFYLGVYPVTLEQYERVMRPNKAIVPSLGPDERSHPVTGVTWWDADAFCMELSELPPEKAAGRVYRLPTEAEWEYACRAGTSTPFHIGNALSSGQASFDWHFPYRGVPRGPLLRSPTPVGSYPPNAFGLYDMHGNVWEWCQDWYDESAEPRERVVRGGSWVADAEDCRSAARGRMEPDLSDDDVGFRVALDA